MSAGSDTSASSTGPARPEPVELVESVVRSLRDEIGLHAPLDAGWLDEPVGDLGLGSLELVELMVRLEDELAVTLPADVLVSVETPSDVVAAVGAALGAATDAPAVRSDDRPERPPIDRWSGLALGPADGQTLVDVLAWHVERQPGREHVRVLGADGVDAALGYAATAEAADRIAVGLVARGVEPGDRVAMMLPSGREYFETFLGVLTAGAVPVPIYPPARRSQLVDHMRRQTAILANCGAVSLVTVPEARPVGRMLRSEVPTLRDLVVAADLPAAGPVPTVRPGPDDVAFLQYTSGSTGSPKGVVLTHANLLANIRAMAEAAQVGPADVFVSWLPLYHDMGLIGAWLGSLVVGMPLVVMSPLLFLSRPSRWLRAIHDHGGTVSAGPNFAYGVCAARVRDEELEGLDLSTWRLAFNGAEPVHPDTLEGFAHRFAPYGFRREALMPVYGLAESSVGLTFPPPGRGPLVDRVRRADLVQHGNAVPAPDDDATALRFVSCGSPLPDHEIRIADTSGAPLGERREGRILFRGPSTTSGYFDSPDADAALHVDGWLDSGDLGYLARGELHVTGRVKDMIVRAGRNVHPEEVEAAVGLLGGVRTGCVATFAVREPDGVGEHLVVLAETRVAEPAERDALRDRISAACVDVVQVAPDQVVLADPGTVLKTSSGKVRRSATRDRYERGDLGAERPDAHDTARLAAGLAGVRARGVAAAVSGAAWRAWAWMLVAVVVLSAVPLLSVLPGLATRRRLARSVARSAIAAGGIRLEVEGLEQLPEGATVVVANHASWLDAVVLTAALPARYTYVAGEVLAGQRLVGFVLRRLGTRYVERDERTAAAADEMVLMEAVRSGESLVMFPEGRLDPEAGLRRFRLGAFLVAADAHVPVVPVALAGTRSVLPPGGWAVSRGSVRVVVSEPLVPQATGWSAAVSLQRAARSAVLRHCGEPDRPD